MHRAFSFRASALSQKNFRNGRFYLDRPEVGSLDKYYPLSGIENNDEFPQMGRICNSGTKFLVRLKKGTKH